MPNTCYKLALWPAAFLCVTTFVAPNITYAQDSGNLLQPGISLEIGGGGSVSPSYEGSSRYMLSPYPIVDFHYLKLPNGSQLGGTEGGLSISPSYNYRGERSASDDPELAGLNTVDAAIELGAEVGYRIDRYELYVDLLYGVTGHHGWTAELGANMHFEPTDRIDLAFGPRLSFADSDYMDSYFSVTSAEAAASSFSVYDASAGLKTVGVEAEARYKINGAWSVRGVVLYDRLIGDAADSPITTVGSKNQFGFKAGLMRKFHIDF